MDIKKLQELCKDEAFITSLLQLDTPQQVKQALSSKGVDLTVEQINQVNDFIARYQQGQLTDQEKKLIDLMNQNDNDELNEQQLEAVAGGFIEWIFLAVALSCSLGAVAVNYHMEKTRRRW